MKPDEDRPITEILEQAAAAGDVPPEFTGRLFEAVYAELRRIAGALMKGEQRDHTLQPTALVHEAYVKLALGKPVQWEGRRHFLGVAAKAMRHILVDAARRRATPRHGGNLQRITLTASALPVDEPAWEVLSLHRALEKLARHNERMARVVELRVFAGCPAQEAAALLGVSKRTADSDWKAARLWLAREMSRD